MLPGKDDPSRLFGVGVAGLAYQFLGHPFRLGAWAFGQGVDLIPQGLSAPPDLDVEQLMTLLAGAARVRGDEVVRVIPPLDRGCQK